MVVTPGDRCVGVGEEVTPERRLVDARRDRAIARRGVPGVARVRQVDPRQEAPGLEAERNGGDAHERRVRGEGIGGEAHGYSFGCGPHGGDTKRTSRSARGVPSTASVNGGANLFLTTFATVAPRSSTTTRIRRWL